MLVHEYLKNKDYLRSKDKTKNDMMYQDIYNCICQNTKNEDILSSMSNLQPNWCFRIDFQKVDQHAGGKWLIHDTKRRKDNQLQSLKLPCRISKIYYRYTLVGFVNKLSVLQRKMYGYHCQAIFCHSVVHLFINLLAYQKYRPNYLPNLCNCQN